ncbi:Uncharacterized protein PBTT_05228 [Plasmodiophora brassicae]
MACSRSKRPQQRGAASPVEARRRSLDLSCCMSRSNNSGRRHSSVIIRLDGHDADGARRISRCAIQEVDDEDPRWRRVAWTGVALLWIAVFLAIFLAVRYTSDLEANVIGGVIAGIVGAVATSVLVTALYAICWLCTRIRIQIDHATFGHRDVTAADEAARLDLIRKQIVEDLGLA